MGVGSPGQPLLSDDFYLIQSPCPLRARVTASKLSVICWKTKVKKDAGAGHTSLQALVDGAQDHDWQQMQFTLGS